jgi:multidrug efflux pump subunit AcrB
VVFFHSAPEATLGGCLGEAFMLTGILVFTVLLAQYVMPLIGSVFFPERNRKVMMWTTFSRKLPKPRINGGQL